MSEMERVAKKPLLMYKCVVWYKPHSLILETKNIELEHNKTNKMTAPNDDSDQPVHLQFDQRLHYGLCG